MAVLNDSAIKTYRYLRLAMVDVIFLLALSVAVEWWNTGRRCFQTSISAYYYTPVQAVFVGTLIAIGVCMIAIKGNSPWEDVLLNLGGMLAPAVALVPTPGAGDCRSVPAGVPDSSANIANNMTALFVAGFAGLVLGVALLIKERQRTPPSWVGVGFTLVVMVGGFIWFLADRHSFTEAAHYTAALLLFGCVIGVVLANSRRSSSKRHTKLYRAIAGAMMASLVIMLPLKWLANWDHALLWLESTLIVLFAVFWISQTNELWRVGLRDGPDRPVSRQ
jgi:hypothetical protein